MVHLELLKPCDEAQFIKDNQYAFKYGAAQYYNEQEMETQYEEEGEIIAKETIYNSIHHEGAIAYRIYDEKQIVGGIVINIQGEQGELELFFVNPDHHSSGIGQAAWKEIERTHPEVRIWVTVTPCFEKRNTHFYVNKLGFHIVAYYNEHNKDPEVEKDLFEMFKFQKIIAKQA